MPPRPNTPKKKSKAFVANSRIRVGTKYVLPGTEVTAESLKVSPEEFKHLQDIQAVKES